MSFCHIQGVKIGYLTSGSQDKGFTVVMVHGAGGNARRWDAQLPAVGRNHYAVAIDLPGHPPSEGRPCEQVFLYRSWLKEFIDELNLKNIVLVGHSMGGGIVADYTLMHPGEIKGLILVGTAARFNIPEERLRAILAGPYDPASARNSFSSHASEKLIQQFAAENAAMDPQIRYTDLVACNRYEEKGIEQILCPTLIIGGMDDTGTSPADAREMKERIPDSRLLLVENASHYVMMEKPDIVNEAIVTFLSDIS